MRRRTALPVLVTLALGIPGIVFQVVTATGASPAPLAPSGSWPYPNADLANTRVAEGSTISSSNVASLEQAWTFAIKGPAARGVSAFGSLAGSPIVERGVVYLQDLYANVYALTLGTGRLLWEYRVNSPLTASLGPDGVAGVDGVVFGDSPSSVFALRATTGRVLWIDRHLLTADQGTFGIQPEVDGGRVYLASALGTGPHGGVLMALDARSGAVLWRFDTLRQTHAGVVAAGGAWETPLVGADGSVTFGTGNPYQSVASAVQHPSSLAYTDSEVNLNAATGKLRWYYQGVPDDFKDYDMQASPMAATVNGIPSVIGAGKMGDVYAINAKTGALIWKTPVGDHNGHDDDSLLASEGKSALSAPFTYEPGSLGGVLSNLSVSGTSVFVATINLPFQITNLDQIPGVDVGTPSGATATGDVEALNLQTGAVEWQTPFSQMALGGTTVSNDLVFTTLYNGVLVALDAGTGAVVFQRALPTSANSTIAIAGNTVLVPAGGPETRTGGHHPQLVAYTIP